ncbi:MAG: menaquinone biosynthesis protein [Planctomycetes bacterium]|nr:menaquinone biosynthesis protein [Planctomycetota bacterium]
MAGERKTMIESDKTKWRLGVVSFLNAKPLIAGLQEDPKIDLVFDVPSRLSKLLDDDQVDAALVPVIDLVEKGRTWQIVSDACIGGDGETLTVRVFSRRPPETIRTLHVDGESHTSVVLARIIWQEQYGIQLDVKPFHSEVSTDDCEAILLIGDKVVSHSLIHFDIETDLGSAWKSLTGLPFVFAVWAAPRDMEAVQLANKLENARNEGVATASMIAADFGPGMGWPVTLATRYLTTRLKFTLGDRQRQGMARFLKMAEHHRLIPAAPEIVYA